MSSRERSIKAAAIGLGIFLVVVIMATILSVLVSIVNVFDLPKDGVSSVEEVDMRITEIEVDLKSTSLRILKGKTFEIKKDNISEEVKIDMSGGILKVKEESFKFWKNKAGGVLSIYVPGETILSDLDISIGAGKVEIDDVVANRFDLEQGAGKVKIKSSVFNEVSIDGGAGKIDIEDTTLKNLDMTAAVGSTHIEGHILGDSKIECGVGSVKLKLYDSREDYRLEVEKGIGSIKIDGEDAPTATGNGANSLKIEGGVGSVSIDFKG